METKAKTQEKSDLEKVLGKKRRFSFTQVNALLASFGFFFIFCGEESAESLLTKFNDQLGYYSLAILYLTFAFSLLILAPPLVKMLGPRICMVIGSVSYLTFVLSMINVVPWVFLTASAFIGFGGAILWCGNGYYLIRITKPSSIGTVTGLFQTLLFMGILTGNIIITICFNFTNLSNRSVFYLLASIIAVGIVCLMLLKRVPKGYSKYINNQDRIEQLSKIKKKNKTLFNMNNKGNFDSDEEKEELFDESNLDTGIELDLTKNEDQEREQGSSNGAKPTVTFAGCDNNSSSKTGNVNKTDQSPVKPHKITNDKNDSQKNKSFYQSIKRSVKVTSSKKALLIMPIMIIEGLSMAIIYGFLPPMVDKKVIPILMFSFTALKSIFCFVTGKLIDRIGNFVIAIFSILIHTSSTVICFFLAPSKTSLFFITYILSGIGNAGLNTLQFPLTIKLFPNDTKEAVAMFKFARCIALGTSCLFIGKLSLLTNCIILLSCQIWSFFSVLVLNFTVQSISTTKKEKY
ncbi:et translation product-related [Anaeramoeba flamelloides]|uniref:Et translation product-related n=1 Tax=Anaeramoeba flamelloides TaxID=1746091 RepID=A0ABQ8Z178_9EUKA|nr:et translation product-related [Anaeramoeba flamelloides]